jgi:hypothetical protein
VRTNSIWLWSAVVVAGCAYHPGSFRDHDGPWPGTALTSGCLDLAVASNDEADVNDPVVAYSVGNRCDHRLEVDLAALRVVGRDASGREGTLVAFDPRAELQPTTLNALWSGRAKISYRGALAGITSICVDVGSIDRAAPYAERWVCVEKVLR